MQKENEYNERKWFSRHNCEDGSACMTFKEALEDERKALNALQKRFPKSMFADLCRRIHHGKFIKHDLIIFLTICKFNED